ncbi:hypothetical protein EIP91_002945 [Steccherinum ochraceum]|uniref:SHSP domain-containing protein n=1 Tax=Steccherinum ochraceum TaxID=92696 RepID=A0A4V2MW80_9APHY|nr:hypothetical protein EIP91_002945 [Steccherinum ochraceum]
MPNMPAELPTTPRKAIPPAFDALIEKAFAPKSTPVNTPRLKATDPRRSMLTISTIVPDAPPEVPDPESKLLEIWEQVREAKAKQLESQPSKVKSLESKSSVKAMPRLEALGLNKTLSKRKSMVNFREALDGETVTATFEMGGVRKQDMHVSFRQNRIVVTWRRTRVVEKMEGSIKVREKQEKQYNQIIPIPEGTKFEHIKATRDGRRLTLTYPNFKGVAKEQIFCEAQPPELPDKEEPEEEDEHDDHDDGDEPEQQEPPSPRTAMSVGDTEFHTCVPDW